MSTTEPEWRGNRWSEPTPTHVHDWAFLRVTHEPIQPEYTFSDVFYCRGCLGQRAVVQQWREIGMAW